MGRESATQERENAASMSQLEREAAVLDEQLILAKQKKEMGLLENARLQNEVGLKTGSQ